jgi:hypothetical protein
LEHGKIPDTAMSGVFQPDFAVDINVEKQENKQLMQLSPVKRMGRTKGKWAFRFSNWEAYLSDFTGYPALLFHEHQDQNIVQ